MYFNPRPREEGDAEVSPGLEEYRYFNPRPREEGDVRKASPSAQYKISIHALVKRATISDLSEGGFSLPFQSTPS